MEPVDSFAYLKLPGEVREVILSNVRSAADRLNILKTIPSEGEVMKGKWNQTDIYMELIIPIVFQKCPSLHWTDLFVLCQVNQYLQRHLCKLYEDSILKLCNSTLFTDDCVVFAWDLPQKPEQNFAQLVPIPVEVVAVLEVDGRNADRSAQWKLLSSWGNHIWNVTLILVWISPNPIDVITKTKDCLQHLPNLKRLSVNLTCLRNMNRVPVNFSNDVIRSVNGMEFPGLLSLRHVNVCGYGPDVLKEILLNKVISTIGNKLQNLAVDMPISMDNIWIRQEKTLDLSQLRALSFSYNIRAKIHDMIRFCQLIVKASVKIIEVTILNSEARANLVELVAVLSGLYGSSLKSINVNIITEDDDFVFLPPNWLSELNFPNLQEFSLKYIS